MKLNARHENGVSLIELMLVLAVIATVIVLAVRYYAVAERQAKVASAIAMVNEVVDASYAWQRGQPNFTGITVTKLKSAKYVADKWGSGVGINPWGGNLVVSSASSGNDLTVELTGLPSGASSYQVCENLKQKLDSKSKSAGTCTSGKYKGTF